MEREYMQKWADELLEIAQGNWGNLILLNKLLSELKYRASNAGVRVREIIEARIEELRPQSSLAAFKWPTTAALAGDSGFTGDQYWYQEGLLSYVGYRVGKTHGVGERTRRQILHCVLFNELPRVNSPDYIEEWGAPRTDKRLKKMAESIASFARNAKRNNSTSMKYAIADWENDLSYLFKNYYHRSLGFCWPDTGI